MKLYPLKCLQEIVDNGLSVSRAARKLNTSPSGISKQIKLLEEKLGLKLLHRKSTRITGLSDAGLAALPIIRRVLKDTERVRRISDEVTGQSHGQLTIASTHNHARYALVPAIKCFVQAYPGVELQIRSGTPAQISQWVVSGDADIGIGTALTGLDTALVKIPCYELRHCVVVPRLHPLLRSKKITLDEIANYPLIINYPESRVGRLVEEAFSAKGINFRVAIRAMDSSVMKKYVEEGLGVAILPEVTVSHKADNLLKSIPASHLFKPGTTCIIMTREQTLPEYGMSFVRMVTQRAIRPKKRAAI